VYFHDDRLSNYSENKLSTYSDGRTKTLSGEAVSSEKSDEICDKTDDEEGNKLSLSTDRIVAKENNSKDTDHESVLSKDLYFEENNRKFIEDECDMCKKTKYQIVEAQALVRNTFYVKGDVVPDRLNDKLTMEQDVPDESYFKNVQCAELMLENQPSSQTLRRRHNKTDTNPNRISVEISDTSYKKADTEIKPLRSQDCDSHVINLCTDIQAVSHDAEIISCESKQKTCTSRSTTRSNSAHSQDISDHAGNVRLKLKAYKVTERYKSNIMGKRTKCRKCCCVVS